MKHHQLLVGDKLLFILALAVLAAAFIGFGISRTAAPRVIIPNVVFTQWWEDYLEEDVLPKLIKEFENTHGGIKIALNHQSYEDLHKELLGAGNNTPAEIPAGDIITLDTLWIPELQKKETLEFQWFRDLYQFSLEDPLISFVNVFYYNVEILKEAGFSHPPKNRSEFLNFARAVTSEEEGRWALSMGRNSARGIYDDVFPWIWAAGAELIKNGKPSLNSRSVTESLAFLASLESGGLIVPGGSLAAEEKKLEDFISGRAVFMIAPARDIKYLRERMGDDAFSVTSIPTQDNYAGKTYFASMEWALGINSESAHKEEAKLFAEFIAAKAQTLSEKLMSGNRAQDPFYSKVDDISIAGESAGDFTGLPWGRLEEIFSEELNNLFAGQATAAETGAAIQKRWEAVLLSL